MMRRRRLAGATPVPVLFLVSALATALVSAFVSAFAASPAAAQPQGGAGPAPETAGRGFAGLGAEAEGFAPVTPERRIRFPQDYGAHPGHRIEWWYLTANLRDADGADYGVQWTLFRQAVAPPEAGAAARRDEGWSSPQLWMAHAAATSAAGHFFEERLARGGVGQAGAEAEPFAAWMDDWRMSATGAGLSELSVSAEGADFSYALDLRADGPIALQGRAGYSVKSDRGDGPPQASYYYSQPSYRASGVLRLGDRTVSVEGRAWLDREWSSQPLAPEQLGWDWFSLHLESGEKVMLFQLRRSDGGAPDRAGNWIDRAGRSVPLDPDDIFLEPLESEGSAPTAWRIQVRSRGVEGVARAINPDAWQKARFAYWEGPVRFEGAQSGIGFLEMTGYTPPWR